MSRQDPVASPMAEFGTQAARASSAAAAVSEAPTARIGMVIGLLGSPRVARWPVPDHEDGQHRNDVGEPHAGGDDVEECPGPGEEA